MDTSQILPGGHRWMRCSCCRQPAIALEPGGRCWQRAAIVKVTKEGIVTYSCGGVLYAPDRLAKKAEAVCERHGCGNVVAMVTALGEGVCWRCLVELGSLGGAGDG